MKAGQSAALLGILLAMASAGMALSQSGAETIRPKPRPILEPPAITAPPDSAVPEAAASASAPPPPEAPAPAEAAAAPAPTAPRTADTPPRDPNRGAVTNLPLPRFVSLKTDEGNARRGPGLTHRIDWVFTRAGMPLRITAEYENWRRVEDADGLGGWVHYSLLSGVRSVLIAEEAVDFRSLPRNEAPVVFRAEQGVVGRVISCADGWCRIQIEGERGWAPAAALWGVAPDEIID